MEEIFRYLENHPVMCKVVGVFALCCVVFAALVAFLCAVVAFILPIVTLMMGNGFDGWLWAACPLLFATCLCCGMAAMWLFDEFVERR